MTALCYGVDLTAQNVALVGRYRSIVRLLLSDTSYGGHVILFVLLFVEHKYNVSGGTPFVDYDSRAEGVL